ncbi:type II secretion system F family protein [Myxococcota bacterium]|nr:type II secretion system F family protein [Myxococcota bacterium]
MPWETLPGTAAGAAVASLLVALAIASVWLAVGASNQARASLEARVRRLHGPGRTVTTTAPSSGGAWFSRLGARVRPWLPEKESALRDELAQAGFRSRHAVEGFVVAQVTLATGLPALYLAGALWFEPDGTRLVGSLLALTALGFALPGAVASRRARARRGEIQRSLPEALDLLVTCVEAGLGLDAALRRVADELSDHRAPLGSELRLTHLEVAAGIPRAEALHRLARRTGIDDLRSLVAVLVQTERFGTSVAQALRTQAESMRTTRQLRAEQAAGESPVKLSAILVVFLLPCLVMVVLSGAAVRVYHALFQGGLGG